MKHYRLPHTTLDVSAFCFGASSLGTTVRGAEADRLVGAFLDVGGNFFDTAHCYAFWEPDGLGASERELGASLRRLGAWDAVIVATKGGHPDAGPDYRCPDAYLSPEVIAADLDDSLRRLAADCIPLYYLHRDDPRVPVGEIVDMLNAEIARGRICYLGASNWSTERMAAANAYAAQTGQAGFVASELQWSLATPTWTPGPDPTPRYVTPESATWHAAAGLPIIAYSATASGYFAHSTHSATLYDTPVNRARRGHACELATQLGCTPTQIALTYLMHQTPLTIPIFGTTNPAHLEEILGSAAIVLAPELLAQL